MGKKKSVGGYPKSNLLPESFIERKLVSKMRSRAILFMLISVAIVVFSVFFLKSITYLKESESGGLTQELDATYNSQTVFAELTRKESEINNTRSTLRDITEKEINWAEFMSKINNSLPNGMNIGPLVMENNAPAPVDPDSIDLDNLVPDEDDSNNSENNDVNVISGSDGIIFNTTVHTNSLASLETWRNNLQSINGFVQVDFLDSTGNENGQTVQVKLHFNNEILWNRFEENPVDYDDAIYDDAMMNDQNLMGILDSFIDPETGLPLNFNDNESGE